MLLAVDIGNTNVKFALYDGAEQVALWRIASERHTADEYAAFLAQSFALRDLTIAGIQDAIVVSVVPEVTPHIMAGIEYLTHRRPLLAGETEAPIPVECLIDRPQEAGRDRLVGIVAARTLFTAPLLMVDFGTATTFTIVDEAGRYCGGAIAPGVNISRKALQEAAAKLPQVDLVAPPQIHARNTIHAMQSGIYYGTIAMAEGMIARFEKSFGAFASVVTSGGLSRLFAGAIEGVTATEPDLTLIGLMLLYELNLRTHL